MLYVVDANSSVTQLEPIEGPCSDALAMPKTDDHISDQLAKLFLSIC